MERYSSQSSSPEKSDARTAPLVERAIIDQIIAAHANKPGALLGVLESVRNQHPNRYLPVQTLRHIAERMDLPLSQIFSVATFYSLFSLAPLGRNTVSVCRGTACHTHGSRTLLDRLVEALGLEKVADGQPDKPRTTADGKTTLRTVACLGQCALAPVVEINRDIHGHVDERTLLREVEALES